MYTIKKIKKKYIFLCVMGVIVFLLLAFAQSALSNEGEKTQGMSLSDKECAEFLGQYGWEISPTPDESVTVTIPEKFDAVYENYNALQKTQGYDLSIYKGCIVERRTYIIKNYPDAVGTVKANLLIYDTEIIGGDICTAAIDGFMHGFALKNDAVGIIGEEYTAVMSIFE